jgi:hypothetical protein
MVLNHIQKYLTNPKKSVNVILITLHHNVQLPRGYGNFEHIVESNLFISLLQFFFKSPIPYFTFPFILDMHFVVGSYWVKAYY